MSEPIYNYELLKTNIRVIFNMTVNSMSVSDDVLKEPSFRLKRRKDNDEASKGTEWMPWCQQAMKDAISCDKRR